MNETEPVALVRLPDVAVAVHVSALESLSTKSTLPEEFVGAVAACVPAPAVRAGVALPICAVQVEPVFVRVKVTAVPAAKTGLPAASWT